MADRVITIASTGGDYTTFPLALAGESDFGVGDDNIIFRRTDNVRETNSITISGFSTSATHKVILECTADAQHDGTRSSGAGIDGDFGWWSAAITVSISYVEIRNLELRDNHLTGIGVRATTTSFIKVENCLIYDCTNRGINFESDCQNRVSVNNLIYNCGIGIYAGGGWAFSQDGAYIYNNTILNSVTYGIHKQSYSYVFVKNTYCGGSGTADFYDEGNGSFTLSYCASSDNTAPTLDSSTSYEIEVSACDFTSSTDGSENANISSESDLIGIGTNLSGDAVYPFNTDIFGNTRNTLWCIGAVEYVATVAGNTYYYQQQQM